MALGNNTPHHNPVLRAYPWATAGYVLQARGRASTTRLAREIRYGTIWTNSLPPPGSHLRTANIRRDDSRFWKRYLVPYCNMQWLATSLYVKYPRLFPKDSISGVWDHHLVALPTIALRITPSLGDDESKKFYLIGQGSYLCHTHEI